MSFIYVSIFFFSLSIGIFNPLLPLYAQSFGASYLDLGLIGTIYALPFLLLSAPIGILSDKFGRKPFLLTGLICSVFATGSLSLASDVQQVAIFRLFGGLTYCMVWPTVEALIIDITSAGDRAKAMGRYSFSWSAGYLSGPPIGGLIMENLGFHPLFTVAALVAAASPFTTFYGLRVARKTHWSASAEIEKARKTVDWKVFAAVYTVVITYSIAFSVVFSIFPAYASNAGITSFEIGILFAVLEAARTFTFLSSESLSRVGEGRSMGLALVLLGANMVGLSYLRGFTHLLVLMVFNGLAIGVIFPIALSAISKLAPSGRRGMTIGFIEASIGLGMTLGPLIGGVAAEALGASSPYLIIAFISGLTLLPVAFWRRRFNVEFDSA
ncbi:MAG: MFS transporter [Nitrososphaeria archaeon]|nr:MFS transporter [Nitrososphaeria archaeon]